MGNVWFYRLTFGSLVIIGILIPETIPLSLRLALVDGGIGGLMFDEQISEDRLEFEQQGLWGELNRSISSKKEEDAEVLCRDLSLPANPDEGY